MLHVAPALTSIPFLVTLGQPDKKRVCSAVQCVEMILRALLVTPAHPERNKVCNRGQLRATASIPEAVIVLQ